MTRQPYQGAGCFDWHRALRTALNNKLLYYIRGCKMEKEREDLIQMAAELTEDELWQAILLMRKMVQDNLRKERE